MGSPESEARRPPSSAEMPSSTSDIEKSNTGAGDYEPTKLKEEDGISRQTSISTASFALNDSTPITYHYLTFSTTLPDPTSNTSNNGSSAVPPPLPDLRKYENPFDWPSSRKNFMIIMSCVATAVAAYTAGSYSPAAAKMSAEWHVSNVAVMVGITTFCLGFAAAPMILAPFSEINGRYPVFIASGIVFLIGQLCCALTPTYAGMIVSRFIVGCGSSVFSTMVGGVVSDLYHAQSRNTPMALFSGAALVGTGLGPLVSGFVAQNINWRWIFWIQVIDCAVLNIAFALFFRETRGSILLSRKAKALNKWYEEREQAGYYGFEMPLERDTAMEVPDSLPPPPRTQSQRIRWKVKSDEERVSLMTMISISVYRPMHLLVTEPVVFFFSLWVAFAWAVLYLTFGSIPLVFSRSHHFNTEQSGAVFASMSIGAALATILSIYQDKLLAMYLSSSKKSGNSESSQSWSRKLDLSSPEGRLYFACIESWFLPAGLFWFGWGGSFTSVPWIVPVLAIACATMGIYSIYLATFNYLADTYHRYASSALAAQSACRNVLGGVFPLVTVQMFSNLGFGAASSLLGGIAVLLTAVPWVLVFYGPTIRRRSKFASEIM